jgi:hypothetical protein
MVWGSSLSGVSRVSEQGLPETTGYGIRESRKVKEGEVFRLHPLDFKHSILGTRGRSGWSGAALFYQFAVLHRNLVTDFEVL